MLQASVQAIAMDEDAELAGLSDQSGPKVGAGGAIPAGAMMATPGDQTQRKMPLDRGSDPKQTLDRPSQEPPLLPHAQSGSYPAQCALPTCRLCRQHELLFMPHTSDVCLLESVTSAAYPWQHMPHMSTCYSHILLLPCYTHTKSVLWSVLHVWHVMPHMSTTTSQHFRSACMLVCNACFISMSSAEQLSTLCMRR